MYNQHPLPLKNQNPGSYQLDSTANSAYLAHFLGGLAELAVLQNGPQDFDFFNCHVCETFNLYDFHCYLSPLKSWHNNSFLGSVLRHIVVHDLFRLLHFEVYLATFIAIPLDEMYVG